MNKQSVVNELKKIAHFLDVDPNGLEEIIKNRPVIKTIGDYKAALKIVIDNAKSIAETKRIGSNNGEMILLADLLKSMASILQKDDEHEAYREIKRMGNQAGEDAKIVGEVLNRMINIISNK